jgi:hypothetical protein
MWVGVCGILQISLEWFPVCLVVADAFIILSFRINFSNTFEQANCSILENILVESS